MHVFTNSTSSSSLNNVVENKTAQLSTQTSTTTPKNRLSKAAWILGLTGQIDVSTKVQDFCDSSYFSCGVELKAAMDPSISYCNRQL